MKQNLLFFAFFIICTTAQAQDYIPFLDNTSWYVTVAGWGGSNDVWVTPDTAEVTVGSYTYVSYSGVPLAGTILVREDVEERRVYRNVDGVDELLYDFSLEVNDMVEMPGGVTYTVTSRDSLPAMTGRKRVKIALQGYNSIGYPLSEVWYEGVGTWAHPLRHFYELPSDPATYIKCSFTDGQHAYNVGLINTGNPLPCDPPVASVPQLDRENLLIYKNPENRGVIIASINALQNATVTLYNSLGQNVQMLTNLSGNSVPVPCNGLAAGVYMLQLEMGGSATTFKIVLSE